MPGRRNSMRPILSRLALAGIALIAAGGAHAQSEATPPLPAVKWSFDGPFGTFDRAALQRGFQVYNQVCSNCHSMNLLAYGDLAGPSALGYTEEQVQAILIGFRDPPTNFPMADGMNYNLYFPGHQIAMPPPLQDDSVAYADGTKATLDQEARDVATFLTWASEPTMEERKRTGVKVILFLLALTGVLYGAKRRIWASLH